MKKKKLKFLIDENVPLEVGLEIKTYFPEGELVVYNEKLRGNSDQDIYNYAILNKFIIITFDLDFMDIIRYPIKNNFKIICRLKNLKISLIKKKIITALKEIDFRNVNNSLVIISNRKIKIRKFNLEIKNDNFKS